MGYWGPRAIVLATVRWAERMMLRRDPGAKALCRAERLLTQCSLSTTLDRSSCLPPSSPFATPVLNSLSNLRLARPPCRLAAADSDDNYEYRHVILPKPMLKLIPKRYVVCCCLSLVLTLRSFIHLRACPRHLLYLPASPLAPTLPASLFPPLAPIIDLTSRESLKLLDARP